MDQKPSVGRIVHFGHPVYDKDRQDSPVFAEPWAAMITQVNADDTVHLAIFPPDGVARARQRVKFSPELNADNWSWPPRV